jgi:hypothetical protein
LKRCNSTSEERRKTPKEKARMKIEVIEEKIKKKIIPSKY